MTTWRLFVESEVKSPQTALALDEVLLQQSQPTLRIWQNQPCIVLGRFDVRLPNIDQAIHAFHQEEMTLLKRSSGGTAVWHGEGVFNVSVFVPTDVAPSGVHESFEALAGGMIQGFGHLGINGVFGQVSGTYCDGPHNLVIDEKKAAGLAQTRRSHGVLVHASILVDLDLDLMHDWIERFYAEADSPQTFARDKVITLSQACQRTLDFQEFVDAMNEGYSSTGIKLRKESPTSEELTQSIIIAQDVLLGPEVNHSIQGGYTNGLPP